ncbi:MAG: HAMP domain-containing histidine kinase [Armatimonadetes bacterium]|nr:HAMP domain-containing histidine kinase [Armatimonadota bacterium]
MEPTSPGSMDSRLLVYLVWLLATGLAVGTAWLCYWYLRKRDAYLDRVLKILQAAPRFEDFESQARALCEACNLEIAAAGTTLYLQPGGEEGGFRRAAQVGQSAEETGPGVVRDLLDQAWKTGNVAESSYAHRHMLAVPVWAGHTGGGALLLVWDEEKKPRLEQRALVEIVSHIASLIAPRFGEEGALARARMEYENLQARAEAEIQTLQAEVAEEAHLASVGRLAAGVAHELNTPLGAVLAMVSSLSRKEEDPSKAKRFTIILDAIDKAKSIIEKLLVYSRRPVETEQGLTFSRFVRAETDMNKVIENTVELLKENLSLDGVSIELDLQELPNFRANSTQWSHVFNNLLTNARDAMKKAGTATPHIKIMSRSENSKIHLEISDNGPGIPQDIRARIFEPFFTTKDVGHGTGLGLAICKEVVRKHGGNIKVGDAPDGGAQFLIDIAVESAKNGT